MVLVAMALVAMVMAAMAVELAFIYEGNMELIHSDVMLQFTRYALFEKGHCIDARN